MSKSSNAKLDKFGRSELHYACNEGNLNKVKELIKSGMDINLKDKQGFTALHFAAQAQNHEIAELLIENGSEVDPLDEYGNTPLFKAVINYRNDGRIIEVLRGKGANPLNKNNYGQTPVGLSRLISNYDVNKYFTDIE